MNRRYLKYLTIAFLPLLGGCAADEADGPRAAGVAMEATGRIGAGTRAPHDNSFDDNAAIGIIPLKAATQLAPSGTEVLADRVNSKYSYTASGDKFLAADNNNKIFFFTSDKFIISAYYPYEGSVGSLPEIQVSTEKANQTLEKQNSTLDILYGFGVTSTGIKFEEYNMRDFKVDLRFNHRMVRLALKVNVSLDGGFTEEAARKIFDEAEFTLSGLKHSATYKPATDEMVIPDAVSASDLVFTKTDNIACSVKDKVRTFEFILIPQHASAFTFVLSYNDEMSRQIKYKTKDIDLNLEAGKSIVIPMTVTKHEIEIGEPEIVDWQQGTSPTVSDGK